METYIPYIRPPYVRHPFYYGKDCTYGNEDMDTYVCTIHKTTVCTEIICMANIVCTTNATILHSRTKTIPYVLVHQWRYYGHVCTVSIPYIRLPFIFHMYSNEDMDTYIYIDTYHPYDGGQRCFPSNLLSTSSNPRWRTLLGHYGRFFNVRVLNINYVRTV